MTTITIPDTDSDLPYALIITEKERRILYNAMSFFTTDPRMELKQEDLDVAIGLLGDLSDIEVKP